MRPEYRPCQVGDRAPIVAGRERRADDAAYACSRNDCWFDTEFVQRFDDADVSEAANSSAAESQADPFFPECVDNVRHAERLSHRRRESRNGVE